MNATAQPSRISQLVERHKQIDHLIRTCPTCSRDVSREVDRLMLEAESETRYFLEQ